MNFLAKLFGSGAAVADNPAAGLPPKAWAEAPATGPTSHKDFLRAEIQRLDEALREANKAILDFRYAHTTFVNGRQVLLYPKSMSAGDARQQFESKWRELSETRERILETRNALLVENAKL